VPAPSTRGAGHGHADGGEEAFVKERFVGGARADWRATDAEMMWRSRGVVKRASGAAAKRAVGGEWAFVGLARRRTAWR